MAIEYQLTLAGALAVERVAERALPDPDERPAGEAPLLAANLYERHGFGVTVRAGKNGYFGADGDTGTWEWEPPAYVSITFRMDKFAMSDRPLLNMLTVVRRVIETGSEDAALVLNGDCLLFARVDGVGVKHHRESWWEHYGTVNDLFPG